ncbi:MAG: hypothetical protein ACFFDF_01620 [Candidatus Odinarchaeota archaeon]
MRILLSDFEKGKKRTSIFIRLSILGFSSCFIVIILLTAYYQGLINAYYPGDLAPIHQLLTMMEFFWMIGILSLFFFINTTIWYNISYGLKKKSIKILDYANKNDVNDVICYKCGKERSNEISRKNERGGIKLTVIFSVKGYFCKECYHYYSNLSLFTIILIPLIYFLCIILILPFLMGIGLSFIPESYWYLYSTVFPVFIITIFVFITYIIYNKLKIMKIYGIKEQKFMK